jgi:hypothetical protein
MGWAVGYDSNWDRDIGYDVPAWCDSPGCSEVIDRGLAYVCGGDVRGGDNGCGLYFCYNHLWYTPDGVQVCERCLEHNDPYLPKPDHPEWVHHKATDPSWQQWRNENA